MFIWLSLSWWYTAGWKWAWQRMVVDRLVWCMDFFSVGTLSRTLFSPFKQIYSGEGRGGIGDFFRSLVDNTISRIIGFLVRMTLIFASLVCMIFVLITGIFLLVFWAFIPLLPALGVILTIVGFGR